MKKFLSVLGAVLVIFSLASCKKVDALPLERSVKTLKVGASPAPHSKILEFVAPILEKEGITLEIIEFTDYVLPNTSLLSGDIDANFFQHKPFLESFNKENSGDLVSIAAVHFEPLGIYPGKTSSIEDISEGAKISVPNDGANEARALLLLQAAGIITLKENAGLNATVNDILDNPKNVKILELEAAQITLNLQDVDLAVVNGNYAVDAGITSGVLVSEDAKSSACDEYANLLVVKEQNKNNPSLNRLAAVLNTDEVREFITAEYENIFVPAF